MIMMTESRRALFPYFFLWLISFLILNPLMLFMPKLNTFATNLQKFHSHIHAVLYLHIHMCLCVCVTYIYHLFDCNQLDALTT